MSTVVSKTLKTMSVIWTDTGVIELVLVNGNRLKMCVETSNHLGQHILDAAGPPLFMTRRTGTLGTSSIFCAFKHANNIYNT